MKDLWTGLMTYLEVPRAAFRYGLWPYYLLAGLISLALGVGIVYGSYTGGGELGEWAIGLVKWDIGVLDSVGNWAGRIIAVVLGLLLYRYVVLICVGPIMGPLSERIERRVVGGTAASGFQLGAFVRAILRGVRITLRNLWRELLFTALLLLLSLVPGFAIVTAPLILLVQAYYAGFANMDYYMERHHNVRGAASYVRSRRGLAIGNGALYLLLLAIPFVGFLIAPGLGATAATLAILRSEQR